VRSPPRARQTPRPFSARGEAIIVGRLERAIEVRDGLGAAPARGAKLAARQRRGLIRGPASKDFKGLAFPSLGQQRLGAQKTRPVPKGSARKSHRVLG